MMPVVALHGFTGTGDSWRAVRANLGHDGPVWCPDLVGHGRAAEIPGVTQFDDEVDRLVAAIRRRFTVPVLLVGYSLGARVALRMLVRHPACAGAAILISGRAGLRDEGARAARIAADQRWINVLEDEGIAAFAEGWQAQPLFASQAALPVASRDAQDRLRSAQSAAGLARALNVLGLGAMPDCWPTLPGLAPRLRLVAGALDPVFVAEAEAMADLLPHAEVEIVPGVGHNVTLEAPDVVAALIDKERHSCL